MKTLHHLIIAVAFCAVALFTQQTAHAEAIGGGSIRITAAQPGTEIKIRYKTEQGTVEKSIAGTEVLRLSTFEIADQGGQFPLLNPTSNQFNLYKSGTTGFILTGGSDDYVRISFDQAATQEKLQLDFQWTPKLEIVPSEGDKVEVLDESDQILHDVDENALFLTSDNGMAIRFVIPEVTNQGGTDPLPPAPQGDSGGCSLAAGAAGNLGSSLCLFFRGLGPHCEKRCNNNHYLPHSRGPLFEGPTFFATSILPPPSERVTILINLFTTGGDHESAVVPAKTLPGRFKIS